MEIAACSSDARSAADPRPRGPYGLRTALALSGALACGIVALAVSTDAHAYPDRPIRMIVAYPAGGSGDIVARTIATPLSAALKQSIVVENVPGASGGIGTQKVIAATADGYTIQLANMTEIVLNPLVNPDIPYDAFKGLAPVAFIGSVPSVLIGRKGLAASAFPDLLTQMRGAAKPMSAGTTGSATPQHIALELLKARAGAPLLPAHYKGGAPALADVLGGHIDLAMVTLTAALPHMKSNAFHVYGVTTATRSPLAPDVPAFAEFPGLAGFDLASWFAVYAPARTPDEILVQLQAAVLAVLRDPEVRTKLEQQGVTVLPAGREELAGRVRDDMQNLRPVVKAADIKSQN
mgnify:CR=1 FL=1